jgi:hypothetical protein
MLLPLNLQLGVAVQQIPVRRIEQVVMRNSLQTMGCMYVSEERMDFEKKPRNLLAVPSRYLSTSTGVACFLQEPGTFVFREKDKQKLRQGFGGRERRSLGSNSESPVPPPPAVLEDGGRARRESARGCRHGGAPPPWRRLPTESMLTGEWKDRQSTAYSPLVFSFFTLVVHGSAQTSGQHGLIWRFSALIRSRHIPNAPGAGGRPASIPAPPKRRDANRPRRGQRRSP